MFQPKLVVLAFILAAIGVSPSAQGQVKPKDVILVVDTITAELQLFLKADGQNTTIPNVTVAEPRRPRHVVQKAREAFLKVQQLRGLNDLPETPLPALPDRELTPADAKDMAQAAYNDLVELRAKYFILDEVSVTERSGDISPTNVYEALVAASDMLQKLNLPSVVPNDVYRVVEAIYNESRAIHKARMGRDAPAYKPAGSQGKSPTNVYALEEMLFADLQGVLDRSGFALPGGLVMRHLPEGVRTPKDVRDLGNDLLAEMGALKTLLQAGAVDNLPAAPSGKTPSDVYDVLLATQSILKAIK